MRKVRDVRNVTRTAAEPGRASLNVRASSAVTDNWVEASFITGIRAGTSACEAAACGVDGPALRADEVDAATGTAAASSATSGSESPSAATIASAIATARLNDLKMELPPQLCRDFNPTFDCGRDAAGLTC